MSWYTKIPFLNEQKYERYLPSAFDESLTLLQKVNKVIEGLNHVISAMNNTFEVVDGQNDAIQKVRDDFEVLKAWLESEGLQEKVVVTLNEWFDSGKLATIINTEVFDMKVDTETFLTYQADNDATVDNINQTKLDAETFLTYQADNDATVDIINQTLAGALENQDSVNQSLTEQMETKVANSDYELFKGNTDDHIETQTQINENTVKRFNNITVDITQPPYNVPTDPTIDATNALQNAFDTVPIRSKVLLPKGTYTITQPLIISRDLTIEGSGAGENGGTLIDVKFTEQYATNYAIIMKSTAKNGRLRNIYLRNSSEEISGLFGVGNTENEPALTHYEFYNVWAFGFTAGFNFHNIYLSTFKACYAVNGYYGFRFVGHSTSLVFEKCYANHNTDNWYIQNIIYSTFISCASDNASRYGYYVSGVDAVSFIACGAETCAMTGIYLDETNAVTIQSFFAVGCGSSTALGVGASGYVGLNNKGTVIDGFYESSTAPTSPRTSSLVVTSADNSSSVLGAVTTKGVYTTTNVLLNGQRRSNIQPNNGTHTRGDFVYNTGSDTSVLGWICVESGSPGLWTQTMV